MGKAQESSPHSDRAFVLMTLCEAAREEVSWKHTTASNISTPRGQRGGEMWPTQVTTEDSQSQGACVCVCVCVCVWGGGSTSKCYIMRTRMPFSRAGFGWSG